MKKQAIKILVAQGFDKTEAQHLVSNMSELELVMVIEEGGI
jgi:hypothetical protein